jgi:hypothetical protein
MTLFKKDFLESLSEYPNFELIQHLDISNKKIKEIKILPKNLISLNCSHNKLKFLPKLPETLKELDCSYNLLNKLIDLPKNLSKLNCSYNKIENLELPDNIININFDRNKITGKLIFKPKMMIISANKNLITSFETLEMPKNIKEIYLNDNKIEYFPENIPESHAQVILEIKRNPIKNKDIKNFILLNTITFTRNYHYHANGLLEYRKK